MFLPVSDATTNIGDPMDQGWRRGVSVGRRHFCAQFGVEVRPSAGCLGHPDSIIEDNEVVADHRSSSADPASSVRGANDLLPRRRCPSPAALSVHGAMFQTLLHLSPPSAMTVSSDEGEMPLYDVVDFNLDGPKLSSPGPLDPGSLLPTYQSPAIRCISLSGSVELGRLRPHSYPAGRKSIGRRHCELVLHIMIPHSRGVATGGLGGSGPPTFVQTPHGICANPLRSVLYIGGPKHVYCIFSLLTSKEKIFGPPLFWGWWGHCPIHLSLAALMSARFSPLTSKHAITWHGSRYTKLDCSFHQPA